MTCQDGMCWYGLPLWAWAILFSVVIGAAVGAAMLVLREVYQHLRRATCRHRWGKVPVAGGLTWCGLVEHRRVCLRCGIPPRTDAERLEADLNHDRAVTAMLEARGE